MSNEGPRVFNAHDETLPRGTFWVMMLIRKLLGGEKVKQDDLIPFYESNGPEGDLFGPAAANYLLGMGGDVLIVSHPEDGIAFGAGNDD